MIDRSKTKNYLSEKNRMTKSIENGACRIACINCPLSRYNNGKNMHCTVLELQHPEISVKIVQEWSNTHPKETYLFEFLRHYPNARMDEFGTPKGVCPHHLGLKDIPCKNGCSACWNQSID